MVGRGALLVFLCLLVGLVLGQQRPTTVSLQVIEAPYFVGQQITVNYAVSWPSVPVNTPLNTGTGVTVVTTSIAATLSGPCTAGVTGVANGANTNTCTIRFLTPGSHDIVATFAAVAGTPGLLGSTNKITVLVSPTNVVMTFSALPAAGTVGAFTPTVQLTAVAPGSFVGVTVPGNVLFSVGGVVSQPTICPGNTPAGGVTGAAAAAGATGCTITFTTGGSAVTITATYTPGSTAFVGNSITSTPVFLRGTSVATFTTGRVPAGAIDFGAALVVTVTGTSNPLPTGTITFSSSPANTVLCTTSFTGATAVCNVGVLLVQTSTAITFAYTGDGNYAINAPAPLAVTVNTATTTITLAGPTTAVTGQLVNLVATVTAPNGGGAPTGTVTFTTVTCAVTNTVALVASPTANTATATCNVASNTVLATTGAITATYSGAGANYSPSPVSAPITSLTITASPTTLTLVTSKPSTVSLEQVRFTATLTAPFPSLGTGMIGNIQFQNAGVNVVCVGFANPVLLGTGTGGYCLNNVCITTCDVNTLLPPTAATTNVITAQYVPGAAPYTPPAAAATVTQTVTPGVPTISVASSIAFCDVSNCAPTFTATTQAGLVPTTGTVTILVDGVTPLPLASCNLVAYATTVTCTPTAGQFPVGRLAITATFTPSATAPVNWLVSISAPVFLDVYARTTTNTISSTATVKPGQYVAITATVTLALAAAIPLPAVFNPNTVVNFLDNGLIIPGSRYYPSCQAVPLVPSPLGTLASAATVFTATCHTASLFSIDSVATHTISALLIDSTYVLQPAAFATTTITTPQQAAVIISLVAAPVANLVPSNTCQTVGVTCVTGQPIVFTATYSVPYSVGSQGPSTPAPTTGNCALGSCGCTTSPTCAATINPTDPINIALSTSIATPIPSCTRIDWSAGAATATTTSWIATCVTNVLVAPSLATWQVVAFPVTRFGAMTAPPVANDYNFQLTQSAAYDPSIVAAQTVLLVTPSDQPSFTNTPVRFTVSVSVQAPGAAVSPSAAFPPYYVGGVLEGGLFKFSGTWTQPFVAGNPAFVQANGGTNPAAPGYPTWPTACTTGATVSTTVVANTPNAGPSITVSAPGVFSWGGCVVGGLSAQYGTDSVSFPTADSQHYYYIIPGSSWTPAVNTPGGNPTNAACNPCGQTGFAASVFPQFIHRIDQTPVILSVSPVSVSAPLLASGAILEAQLSDTPHKGYVTPQFDVTGAAQGVLPTGVVHFCTSSSCTAGNAVCVSSFFQGTSVRCSATALPVGASTIYANYVPEALLPTANFAPANTVAGSVVNVVRQYSSIAITSVCSLAAGGSCFVCTTTPCTAVVTEAVTFTATVSVTAPTPPFGAPTGTVTFSFTSVSPSTGAATGSTSIPGCIGLAITATPQGYVSVCAAPATTFTESANHRITATLTGDTAFVTGSSVSQAFPLVVTKALTVTAIIVGAGPTITGQSVSMSATVTASLPATGTPTGTISFFSDFPAANSPILDCQAVAIGATCNSIEMRGAGGVQTVTAVYSGDAVFRTSSNAGTTTVNALVTTTSLIAPPVNPVVGEVGWTIVAQHVAVAGSLGRIIPRYLPAGTCTFSIGGTNIAGCVAVTASTVNGLCSCTITNAAGSSGVFPASAAGIVVSASWATSNTYYATTAGSLTVNVIISKAPTNVAVVTAPTSPTLGPVTSITATTAVSAPGAEVGTLLIATTGTVAFFNAGVAVAGCGAVAVGALGVSTCNLGVSISAAQFSSITATYSGNTNFATSTGAYALRLFAAQTTTQQVTVSSTSTPVAVNSLSVVYGEALTLVGTFVPVIPAGGTVQFTDGVGGPAICSSPVAAGAGTTSCVPTAALGRGVHTIAMVLTSTSFDVGQLVASSNTALTVLQAPLSVDITSSVASAQVGQSVTFTGTLVVAYPGSSLSAYPPIGSGYVEWRSNNVLIEKCRSAALLYTSSSTATASCTAVFSTDSVNVITANYLTISPGAASTLYLAGPVRPFEQVVTPAVPTLTIAQSPTSVFYGQPLVLTVSMVIPVPAIAIFDYSVTSPTGANNFLFGSTITWLADGVAVPGAACPATIPTITTVSANPPTYTYTQVCTIPAANGLVPGARNITATFSGSQVPATTSLYDYAAATTFRTVTIQKSTTVTTLTGTPSGALVGAAIGSSSLTANSVTFTAVVSLPAVSIAPFFPGGGLGAQTQPTGTVEFFNGGVLITSCNTVTLPASLTASCTTSFPAAIASTITANYNGDQFFATSVGSLSHSTGPFVTLTSISCLLSTQNNVACLGTRFHGQPVTLTATVTALAGTGTVAGTVAFVDLTTTPPVTLSCAAPGSSLGVTAASPVATCVTTLDRRPSSFSGSCTVANDCTHKYVAAYTGTASSTSAVFQMVVQPVGTTITFSNSHTTVVYGQLTQITAIVTPAVGSTNPLGTVDFTINGASQPGCTGVTVCGGGSSCVANRAICSITNTGVGPITSSALYTPVASGAADWAAAASTANPTSITVTAAQPVLSLVSSPNGPALTGQRITLTSTLSVPLPATGYPFPTGSISFQYESGGIVGNCAAVAMTISTTTHSVPYKFADTATCTILLTTPGTIAIRAVLGASAGKYLLTTSNTIVQIVTKATSNLAITLGPSPILVSTAVPLVFTSTLTVNSGAGAPTGLVQFYVNGVAFNTLNPTAIKCSGTDARPISPIAPFLSVCTIAVGTTFPFSAGTYSVNAVWAGDENYIGSTSVSIPLVVIATITQTTLTAPQTVTSAVTGQSITYTATVAYSTGVNAVPAGTINFRDGTTTLPNCGAQAVQSTNGGAPYFAQCTASFPTAIDRILSAVFSSSVATQSDSTSPNLIQTVRRADVVVLVTGGATPAPPVGTSVTFTATVLAANPGAVTANGLISGTITFTAGSLSTGITLCSAVPGVMTTTNPPALTATCTATNVPVLALQNNLIIASYSGDANFNTGLGNLQQTVTKAPSTVVLASNVLSPITGQSLVLTATVSATGTSVRPTGTVAFVDTNVGIVNCGSVTVINVTATTFTAVCNLLPAVQTPSRTGNSFVVVGYPAGLHSLRATYVPDSVADPYISGSTTTLSLTVAAAPTQLSITGTSPVRSVAGSITYTATLTVPAPGSALPRSVLIAAPVASDTPTGTISFSVSGTVVAGCNLNTVNIGGGGWGPFTSSTCLVSFAAPTTGVPILATYTSNTLNYLGSTVTLSQIIVPGTLTSVISVVGPVVTCQNVLASAALTLAGSSSPPTGTISIMAVHDLTGVGTVKLCDIVLPATLALTVSCSGYLSLPNAGGAATYSLTAVYLGDVNYAQSTSAAVTLRVNPGTATVRLTTAAGQPIYTVPDARYGQDVTYIASVIPALPSQSLTGCIPPGVITFQYNSNDIKACYLIPATVGTTFSQSTCNLKAWERVNGFQAQATGANLFVTLPLPDTRDILAVFTNSPTTLTYVQQYASSTSVAGISQTTRKALTTVVVSSATSYVSATAVPLNVVLSATLPGFSPSISGTNGAFTIYQYQGVAAPVALPATCVTFGAGPEAAPTTLSPSCTSTLTLSTIPYSLIARWAPTDTDNYLQFSESAPITVTTVTGTTSTVLLSFPLNPSVVGQTVTYTATVTITSGIGVLTGTVAFTDAGVTIAGCGAQPVTIGASTTQGTASCVPPLYTAIAYRTNIRALYSGDIIFAPSTSNVLTMVTTFAQTSSTVVVSANPIVGAPVTYGLTVTTQSPGTGAPTGIYRILEGSQILCDNLVLGGGGVTGNCTKTYNAVSTLPITGVYLGTVNFATSTSAISNVLIASAPTNVTVSSSVNPSITSQTVTFIATVSVLPPSATGASGIAGVIPTGTVSFSVSDPLCQNRGLALNALVSPTTYQATCTTSFSTLGAQTITATYAVSGTTSVTAGSSGAITQTVVAGQIVTSAPPTNPLTGNATLPPSSTAGNTTRPANATTSPAPSNGLLYLVIVNFQYCISAVQWAQYRQNLANTLRVAVSVVQVITDPSLTCTPAKRQSAQRSTAVVGFGDLATAQAATNAINGGQVQGIPGFPDPTAVLASGATAGSGLSGGQIAGIVVGSVLGFFLIVALIVIAFVLGKKQGGGSEMSGRA